MALQLFYKISCTNDNLIIIHQFKYSLWNSSIADAAAGGSDDWAMEVGGADLSYTVELPGGSYGFAPPPREIIPVGAETFEAIKQFALYVEDKICH